MLRQAIRNDDPVVVMEPKRLYRAVREEVPDDPDHVVPFGRAAVRRRGDDVVLISYGGSMAQTARAADALAAQGIESTVIDLRSLMPWDKETVLEHVARVGRCVLVSEAPRTAGFVSEVAAVIAEEILDALLAPPLRVTGADTPYPYAQDRAYLPGPRRILNAVQRVLEY
jgi:2-oxoisovalerate dehydrogenase E1 component beta subunit